jgi:uncharacterized protein DUF6984
MEMGFRKLDTHEIALLEKLLAHEFPGRDALRVQLALVAARRINENGTLELSYEGGDLAETFLGCPTEGRCEDIDGGRIAVLLHVKNGRMRLLEIFKEDGSEILKPPTGEALKAY